jgi:hypothetical protein
MFRRPVLLAVFLFLCLWMILPQAARAPVPVPVPIGKEIPKNYKTWALFLVCDPSWLARTANSKANLRLLHDQFVGFGNAIGKHNAAIWFYSHNSTDPSDYDGQRASDYCAMYDLKPDENPAVVVTTKYPDPGAAADTFSATDVAGNYIKASLNGLDSNDADTLLGLLANQVRSGKLNQQQIDSKKYWQSWERLLKKTLKAAGNLGRGVTVGIDTTVLKITFSGKDVT